MNATAAVETPLTGSGRSSQANDDPLPEIDQISETSRVLADETQNSTDTVRTSVRYPALIAEPCSASRSGLPAARPRWMSSQWVAQTRRPTPRTPPPPPIP